MHRRRLSKLTLFAVFFVIAHLSGCATSQRAPQHSYKFEKKGVYHKVRRGEALWRIAKSYDVPLDDIVRSNNIPNVAQIEEDQLIFIPGAESTKEIGSFDRPNEFDWPVRGKVVSYFGHRKESGSINKGIDIAVKVGTVVVAARDGRAVFVDYLPGHGYAAMLDHGDEYITVYSQNEEILVDLNDFVLKGSPIARIGSYDMPAFAHFEIRKKEVADNPLYYLP